MKLEWEIDGGSYHYTTCTKDENKHEALEQWWLKLLALAETASDWNIIIADLWIDNTGRIIGNVQNKDEATGMDRGFRVALTFEDFADQLYNASDDDYEDLLYDFLVWCEEMLPDGLFSDKVNPILKNLHAKNPFQIFYTYRGSSDWAEINF